MKKIRCFIVLSLFCYSLSSVAQNSSDVALSGLIAQKNYDRALVIIEQKLLDSKNDQKLLFLKAFSLYHLKKHNLAINNYLLLIKLYPTFPDAYNNLAAIYAKQGNLTLAKKTLEKGIKSNKSYALIHKNINSIYLEMARESYVKALQLGVKKHDVELSFADISNISDIESKTITLNRQFSASRSSTQATNKTVVTTKPVKLTQANNKARLIKPGGVVAVTERTSWIGPKKTVPKKSYIRVAKKKVVVKAWNEPVISLKDEVITALQGWAAAWSAQDVELYLSFYNKQFLPESGATRPVWVSQRQSRLLKPRWIEVRLSNFLVESESDNKAEVLVTQLYRSNSFRDKSKKKFFLKRSEDGWQIINEVNYQE